MSAEQPNSLTPAGAPLAALARVDYRLTRVGRANQWSLVVLCAGISAVLFWLCVYEQGNIMFWLLLPIALYAAGDALRRACGDDWVASTDSQGFEGLSHRRSLGFQRKSFERVGARWGEVASYRFGYARGEQMLIVTFTERSLIGATLTIDVSSITPPLQDLLKAFAAGTGITEGEQRREEPWPSTAAVAD